MIVAQTEDKRTMLEAVDLKCRHGLFSGKLDRQLQIGLQYRRQFRSTPLSRWELRHNIEGVLTRRNICTALAPRAIAALEAALTAAGLSLEALEHALRFISVDPGRREILDVASSIGRSIAISRTAYYIYLRTDAVRDAAIARLHAIPGVQEFLAQLSQHHARTADVAELIAHRDLWIGAGTHATAMTYVTYNSTRHVLPHYHCSHYPA